MTGSAARRGRPGGAKVWRIAWALASLVVAQIVVCGLALAPAAFIWWLLFQFTESGTATRWGLLILTIAPSYVLFALALMVVSPAVLRILRWQTPADVELPIAELDWPVLRWVRYGASIHLVRIIAGTWFRGTPFWTYHLWLCGARVGKRVYVNSLSVSDYNLLQFGDDVVIGGGVHLSGHTVEHGLLKTARVRLGDDVTIGLGSVIEIGVEIGSHAQIGALSFVPKFARLEGRRTYAGAPAVPIHQA